MYGVRVKMTGVFEGCPPVVFGKYSVAFSSILSRIGIFTPQRRSYSGVTGGDSLGEGDGADGGVCAQSKFDANSKIGTNVIRFMVRLNHGPSARQESFAQGGCALSASALLASLGIGYLRA